MDPQPVHVGAAWQDVKRHRHPLAVLALTALVVALVEYFFLAGDFARLFPLEARHYAPGVVYGSWDKVPRSRTAPWWGVLMPWVWWVGGMLALWVVLPTILAKWLGYRLKDLGLRTQGVLPKLWVYGALYAIVFFGVLWASTRENFTQMYPMLKPWYCEKWCWAVLLSWWALYAVQFFVVEFFFRGFLLFTLEKDFGTAAIAVMIVPYCMIHFHKPLPEALGAIVAGTVLGWLALRTRSILGGWMLHCSVAITMDMMALLKGDYGLPHQFWP
jgi:membrane protease YdiL (CAAX protease family)